MKHLSKILPPASGTSGGTRIGVSCIKQWDRCKWQWFLSYAAPRPDNGVGFRRKTIGKALIVGILFHDAEQVWLESGWQDGKFDHGVALDCIQAAMDSAERQREAGTEEQLTDCVATALELFARYAKRCGPNGADPDWERFRIAADSEGKPLLEREWQVDLGYNQYFITSRIDAVGWRCADGLLSAIEHKTMDVGNHRATIRGYHVGPQPTCEQLALSTAWPNEDVGVALNAVIKRAAAANPVRQWVVMDRREQHLEMFRIDTIRKLQAIDEAIEEWLELSLEMPTMAAARLVFTANAPETVCSGQGFGCDFYDICHLGVTDVELRMGHLTIPRHTRTD